jgi:hypothetical protein
VPLRRSSSVFWWIERQIPVTSSTLVGVPIGFGGGVCVPPHAARQHRPIAIASARKRN